MKNATEHARKLAALLKKLPVPAEPSLEDVNPLARLVIGFLQWNATQRAALSAFKNLMSVMVDYNDLRVSRPTDIAAFLGPRYPQVEERAARLRDTLQAIYVREHATSLEPLQGRPGKELRNYLESLPGITPYVTAYTLLWGFKQPAMPVDERLVELLKPLDIAEDGSTCDTVASFLERSVKHEDIREAHLKLQNWADQQAAAPTAGPAAVKRGAARSATKKASAGKLGPASARAGAKTAGRKLTRVARTQAGRAARTTGKPSGRTKKKHS